jgi:hypothetical protein
MIRVGWSALAVIGLFPVTASFAASVIVNPGKSSGTLTVTLEDATVGQALQDLGKTYGFQVVGLENVTASPVSATMTGSLANIVARLLRNRNYLIVRSSDQKGAIVAVKILNSNYGAASLKSRGANAAGTSPQQRSTKRTGP